MKKYSSILIIIATVFLTSCSSPYILIASKKYHFPVSYSKIMTVGVIKDDNDSIRVRIEKSITADLKAIGYEAVSALEEFGPKGLTNLDQEETYLKLCNRGIDAVIIVALIDISKEKQFRTQKSYTYSDTYYYNRIWNYKNIQADLVKINSTVKSSCFWEAILFNLSTLEAECTIQSASFSLPENNLAGQFERQIVKKMIKEKILRKQEVKT
ncbi:MAG TPA: hypothetical protein VFO37_05520, partial [Chitinophagaceae bacterium]|nr:hypothetical protein [Chitinophagaceae bacterium]